MSSCPCSVGKGLGQYMFMIQFILVIKFYHNGPNMSEGMMDRQTDSFSSQFYMVEIGIMSWFIYLKQIPFSSPNIRMG